MPQCVVGWKHVAFSPGDFKQGCSIQAVRGGCSLSKVVIDNYTREKLTSDAIFWWLTTEFPDKIEAVRLIDNMIYYGKIMYLTEVLLPQQNDQEIIGYTNEQYKWCKANEAKMWNYIMENRHLFSTEVLITAKYINPAPFTAFFPNDSPGRTGIWLGWQIVKSYMDKNNDLTLQDLMNNHNENKMLEKSEYLPNRI